MDFHLVEFVFYSKGDGLLLHYDGAWGLEQTGVWTGGKIIRFLISKTDFFVEVIHLDNQSQSYLKESEN